MDHSVAENLNLADTPREQGAVLHLKSQLSDKIILVGLGPHAKRIYVHYLKALGIAPKVLVELDHVIEKQKSYIKREMPNTTTVQVNPELNYEESLPLQVLNDLDNICDKMGITHAIVATEPKSHACYLKYFIERGVKVLCDKPLTSPNKVYTSIEQADKIRSDYEGVLNYLKKNENSQCVVQCQRRWHPGYKFIRNLLEKCVSTYQIPITNLEVYHCDGMWNMPNEFFERENHPYKYGYGKLMHSGYHFVDLMCWLVELNELIPSKKVDNCELYATGTNAYDYFNIIQSQDYSRLMGTEDFAEYLNQREETRDFGEIDVQALIQLKQSDSIVTTCQLNLMQNGFSRRSWPKLPEDTYKGNGRIRHERVNIQVGPLLNIQVHSYQAIEIRERGLIHGVGGVEHFEIYIFRNVGLIGGKAFEKVTIDDLAGEQTSSDFIGYNELARKSCIREFLDENRNSKTSLLSDHKHSIELLTQIYRSLAHRHNHLPVVMNFDW